jgi:hypothetical protein
MYQSVLVHHAEASRYRPGQEDCTLRVLSSRHADEGMSLVLRERQDEPVARLTAPAGLRAFLCQVLAHTPMAALPRPGGDAAAPVAGSPMAGGLSR